jgi:mannose-6-phosphate isomerase-like protein (cupin superfamily)
METLNLNDKLQKINEHWSPKIVAELNGQYVKLAKIKGEFVWHSHADEDELFMVLKGQLKIEFRDRKLILDKGEIAVIPKGVEHRPVAEDEVSILLFEPKSTLNTGDADSELTQNKLDWI